MVLKTEVIVSIYHTTLQLGYRMEVKKVGPIEFRYMTHQTEQMLGWPAKIIK